MVKLQEILEQDREKLIAGLENARTPEKAAEILKTHTEKTLYQFNEKEVDDRIREEAAYMLQVAGASSGFADCVKETRIFERSDADGQKVKQKQKLPLILSGGGLALAALLMMVLFSEKTRPAVVFLSIIFLAAALLLLFLAGKGVRVPGRKTNEPPERHTEHVVDAQKLYRNLHSIYMMIDVNLEEIRAEKAFAVRKDENGEEREDLSGDELMLLSDLLEASYSGDGAYALEMLSNIRYYLHQRQISLVDYTAETADLFDVMPSKEIATMRPALVLADGRLLKKGLAAGG